MDERQLSEEFGVSRTPVREAITRLEQEGFVKVYPRRGAFVVRKSKKEILEMITVWAALESMAARLITQNASDAEIATLRDMFATFDDDRVQAEIDEYSEHNIQFHQAILSMSRMRPAQPDGGESCWFTCVGFACARYPKTTVPAVRSSIT